MCFARVLPTLFPVVLHQSLIKIMLDWWKYGLMNGKSFTTISILVKRLTNVHFCVIFPLSLTYLNTSLAINYYTIFKLILLSYTSTHTYRCKKNFSWWCFCSFSLTRSFEMQKLPLVSGKYLSRESNAIRLLLPRWGEWSKYFYCCVHSLNNAFQLFAIDSQCGKSKLFRHNGPQVRRESRQ